MSIDYSVEEEPLGTAGSVRQAARDLEETFLVISGDALCDIDLEARSSTTRRRAAPSRSDSSRWRTRSSSARRHRRGRARGALPREALLGAGLLRHDQHGHLRGRARGLRHVPADRPSTSRADLFPLLLEMGRPWYGCVLDGYWQDIGNLDPVPPGELRRPDEKVRLKIPGIRLRGDIWIGEAVEIDDLESIEGPAFIGNYSRLAKDASLGAYSVLGTSVTLRERARVSHSVLDSSTHVGRSTLIEGSVIGRSCDIRSHVRLHEA